MMGAYMPVAASRSPSASTPASVASTVSASRSAVPPAAVARSQVCSRGSMTAFSSSCDTGVSPSGVGTTAASSTRISAVMATSRTWGQVAAGSAPASRASSAGLRSGAGRPSAESIAIT